MNLKIKEFNCEKAGFRAIHTENDADMFILWPCIINGVTEFSMHQWNFLSWHCLELKSINLCHFKGFLWLSRSQDIDFLWNRFLQVVSFSMKQRRQKVWVICQCGWSVEIFFLPLQKLTDVVMLFGNFFSFGGSNSSK